MYKINHVDESLQIIKILTREIRYQFKLNKSIILYLKTLFKRIYMT